MSWLREQFLKAKQDVLGWSKWMRREASKMVGKEQVFFDERELGEKCMNCGLRYSTIYRVPDDIWERITGRSDGSGLLCPRCCDALARDKGIILYWEAAEGEYPTRINNG